MPCATFITAEHDPPPVVVITPVLELIVHTEADDGVE